MSDAHTITHALRGRWNAGAGRGMVRCPLHDDRNPSLSIRDGDEPGRILVTCFAGCDRRDIIDELRRLGLIGEAASREPITRKPSPPAEHKPDPAALEIWLAASPATGSVVESYLRHRGITLPVPASLRCGSRLHLDRYDMPAMVAAVQRPDGKIVAAQTTLLTTAGKKATVSIPRITTGALGAGAVRLAKAGDVLGIAEGIETALSAMQLSGVPTWACLGAGRMHRVVVPDGVRELHVFGDNDDAGRAAVERTAHANQHRRCVLRYPARQFKDWNEWLVQRGGVAA
jgi:putative DNA primase/helicase